MCTGAPCQHQGRCRSFTSTPYYRCYCRIKYYGVDCENGISSLYYAIECIQII